MAGLANWWKKEAEEHGLYPSQYFFLKNGKLRNSIPKLWKAAKKCDHHPGMLGNQGGISNSNSPHTTIQCNYEPMFLKWVPSVPSPVIVAEVYIGVASSILLKTQHATKRWCFNHTITLATLTLLIPLCGGPFNAVRFVIDSLYFLSSLF